MSGKQPPVGSLNAEEDERLRDEAQRQQQDHQNTINNLAYTISDHARSGNVNAINRELSSMTQRGVSRDSLLDDASIFIGEDGRIVNPSSPQATEATMIPLRSFLQNHRNDYVRRLVPSSTTQNPSASSAATSRPRTIG